jgi:PleD family two-component response regulator
VTALNEVADVERAVESGADDFLTKPVHRIELITRVKSLLRVRLLKKQLEKTLREVERLTDGEA